MPRSVPSSPLRRLQGLAPFESPCRAGTRLSFPAGRSPPGLPPPQGFPTGAVEGVSPPPLVCFIATCCALLALRLRTRSLQRLHSSVSDCSGSAVLSPERLPSRGFPPTAPGQYEVATILAYRLAALPRAPGCVTAPLRALFEPSWPLPCGPASALFRRSASGSS
jgi:hypothetical protein